MNECTDFFVYKYAKENPLAMAYILQRYKGIEIDSALKLINNFIENVEEKQ